MEDQVKTEEERAAPRWLQWHEGESVGTMMWLQDEGRWCIVHTPNRLYGVQVNEHGEAY